MIREGARKLRTREGIDIKLGGRNYEMGGGEFGRRREVTK